MTDDPTNAQANTSPSQPNPALEPLEVLVGEWEIELSKTSFLPRPTDTVKGLVSFEWVQDGAFLLMHMGDKPPSPPAALWLISRDESSPDYTVLYYDSRSVSRVYEMSFSEGVWKMWRNAPGFHQRYEGTVSKDGKTITAHWEKSGDGASWEHDFDVTYTKISQATRERLKMTNHNQTTITAEPGKQELVITREFDAPRELVFKVITDPKLLPQWWGPRYLSTIIDKMDVRPGGQWRYIQRDAQGNEYAFHGVYHEVLAPERMIDTFEFEGLPETGHVALETMRLEELPGGRTRLITLSVYQSVMDRDGVLQSGMESGVNETYDRLSEILEQLKKEQE